MCPMWSQAKSFLATDLYSTYIEDKRMTLSILYISGIKVIMCIIQNNG